MKTTTQLAATLRLSPATVKAMIEAFIFDFIGQGRPSPFCAADVAFALDGDVQAWEAILLNERANGALVVVPGSKRTEYRVVL